MLDFIGRLAGGIFLFFAAMAICSWLSIGALDIWSSVYSVLATCVAYSPFLLWLEYTHHGKLTVSTTLTVWLTLFTNLLLWRIIVTFGWVARPVPNFQDDKILPVVVQLMSFMCALWISGRVSTLAQNRVGSAP